MVPIQVLGTHVAMSDDSPSPSTPSYLDWLEGLAVVSILGMMLAALRVSCLLPHQPSMWDLLGFLLLPYPLYAVFVAYEQTKYRLVG